MSRHARRVHVGTTRACLALEPLEDRLLLAAAIVGPLPAAGPAPAASSVSPADPTADADSSTYASTPANTAGSGGTTPYAAQGTQPSGATGSSSRPASYSTPYTTNYANDYTTAARTAATATLVATATLALGASNASVAAQQASAVRSIPQAVPLGPAALPGPTREPLARLENVPVQSATVGPVPREAGKDDVQAAPKRIAKDADAESSSPDLVALEAQPALPLVVPLAGLPLGLDLACWERGVRAFFSRLDALGDEENDGSPWVRLAPWCALAGVMAAGLEIARRHLSRQPPPGLVESGGRGLAWRWLNQSNDS